MGFYRGARYSIVPDDKQDTRKERQVTVWIDGVKVEYKCFNCTYASAVRSAKQKIDEKREDL